MELNWLPREKVLKSHDLYSSQHWWNTAPKTIYEKRPLKNPDGKLVDDLFVSWITRT